MTIVEAILAVMRDARRPMTAAEVHDALVKKELYVFKAKQPTQIVHQQIRRHCIGVQNKTSSRTKYFSRAGQDQFAALPQPQTEN